MISILNTSLEEGWLLEVLKQVILRGWGIGYYINTIVKISMHSIVHQNLNYIPNDNTQNYPLFKLQFVVETLDTQLNEITNPNSIKVPKVVKPTYKKTFL